MAAVSKGCGQHALLFSRRARFPTEWGVERKFYKPWMKVKVKVTQSCPALWDPVHGILQARILEWVAIPFSRGSSQPRNRTQVSHIAGGFFTSWATREVKNTGMGSLSLLQGIFLMQESNRGLLHCRWILYQLSHQGKPMNSWKQMEVFRRWEGMSWYVQKFTQAHSHLGFQSSDCQDWGKQKRIER